MSGTEYDGISDDACGDDFSDDADRELNELADLELRAEGSAALLVRTGTVVRWLGWLVVTGAAVVTVLAQMETSQFGSVGIWSTLWTLLLGAANGAFLIVAGTYAELRGLRAQADDARRRLAREL